MPSIDERVVEMRFENEQFEKGIKESKASLEQLKSSLRLEESAKSVAQSLDDISYRFSVTGIAIEQLTRNITNSFYQMTSQFKRTISDLTIDQVGEGFSKYERKLQSVQTIINATGKNIDEVNESLDKLNWFTDETSYDFTSMVDNIGKFTSNQIPLETAITSMIGIADAAGLAGASVSDASHAMDGFSKAMGQGYMSRQNWQWIRTAHMDTAKFKEILIDSALELKTLKKNSKGLIKTLDDTDVSIANFEDGMKDKWLTVDVMNKALAKFGGTTEKIYEEYLKGDKLTSDIIKDMSEAGEDLGLKAFKAAQEAKTFTDAINSVKDAVSTGWMTSFEYIFGNYDEAKVMWTNLANELWDVFNGSAEDRNELLKTWHFTYDGYHSLLRSVSNMWQGIKNIIAPISDAFRTLFPPTTVETLVNATKKFEEFSVKFRDFFGEVGALIWPFEEETKEVAESVTETVEDVVEVVEAIEGPVARTKKVLDELANAVINGDYGNGAEKRRKKLEAEGYSFELVQNRVNELCEAYEGLPEGWYGRRKVQEDQIVVNKETAETTKEVTEAVEENADAIQEYVNDNIKKTHVVKNLRDSFEGLFSVFRLAVDTIKDIGKGLTPLFRIAVQLFQITLSITGALGRLMTYFTSVIKSTRLSEKFSNLLYRSLSKISHILEPVVAWFDTLEEKLAVVAENFQILKTRLLQLESVQQTIQYFRDLGETVKNFISGTFDKFIEQIKTLTKIKIDAPSMDQIVDFIDKFAKKFNEIVEAFKGSTIVGDTQTWFSNLAGGVKGAWDSLLATISDPDSVFHKAYESAKQFALGIVGGMNSINLDTILSVVSTGSLAYFLYTLTGAIRNLSKLFKNIDPTNFQDVMKGITKVLGSMSTNIKAEALIKIAEAIGILALAIVGLGIIDKDQLAQSTAAIFAMMLGLKMLLGALTAYNSMDSKLASIEWTLAKIKNILATALMWQSFGIMVVAISTGLLIFAKALSSLFKVVQETSGVTINQTMGLITGLILGMLFIVSALKTIIGDINNFRIDSYARLIMAFSAACLIMAVGIRVLVKPLGQLFDIVQKASGSSLKWTAILLGSFVAGMAAVTWVLKKGSGKNAAALIGFSVGLLALAAALKILSPMLSGFIEQMPDVFDQLSGFVKKLSAGELLSIVVIVTMMAPALKNLGTSLIGLGIAALGIGLGIRIAGGALETFADGFVKALKIITANGPLIVGFVTAIISGVLTAISTSKGRLVVSIVAVLMGVVEAIRQVGPEVIQTIGEQIQNAIDYTLSIVGEIVNVLVYLVIQIINEVANAIDANKQPLVDACERLVTAFRNVLQEGLQRIFPWLGDGLSKFFADILTFITAASPLIMAITGVGNAFKSWPAMLKKIRAGFENVHLYLYELHEAFHIFSGVLSAGGTAAQGFGAIIGSGLGLPVFLTMAGLTVGAVEIIGSALQKQTDKENEQIRKNNELSTSHQKMIDKILGAYDEYKKKADKLNEEISEIAETYEGYNSLAEEYDKLTDKNGQVIEGNEDTADLILGRLSSALGIERDQLQELIDKHGSLQEAIKETMRIKEAEAMLDRLRESYLDSMSQRSEAQANRTNSLYQMAAAESKLNDAMALRDYYQQKMIETSGDRAEYQKWNKLWLDQGIVVDQLALNLDDLTTAYNMADETLAGIDKNISDYQNLSEAFVEGDIDQIIKTMDEIQNKTVETIKTAKDATKEELKEQYDQISRGYKQLKAEADNGSREVSDEVLGGVKMMQVNARNELLKSYGLFDSAGHFVAGNYSNAVKDELYSLYPEVVDYIENYLVPGFEADATEEATKTGTDYKESLKNALTSDLGVSEKIENIKGLFNFDLSSIGSENADSFISSIIGQLDTGDIDLNQAMGMFSDVFDISDETSKKGKEADESAAAAIVENKEVVEDATETVVTDASAEADAAIDNETDKIGQHWNDGLAKSLYKYADRVSIAASYVSSKIPDVTRHDLGVSSPAKVAMGITKFWDMGLGIGLRDHVNYVTNGASFVSNILANKMKDAIELANDIIGEDENLHPVIRPVMDLSEIQNGSNSIDGMLLNARSFTLAANNGIRFEQNRADAFARAQQMATTNADVVAALGLLRGDVSDLGDTFSNTAVVLDSGALVGATAKQMDNALGRFKVLKGRGI